jgi:C-terminal processing protease CtpA/Prc
MKKVVLSFFIAIAFLYSCQKNNDKPQTGLTDAMARDSLYYLMKDVYYWYDKMPDVNKDDYSDPYKLMDALRYKPLDRFSFVADYNEWNAEQQGSFVGHGFRIGVDESGKARIALIYSRSPLYAQGVRRGWIVKSINGTDVAPLLLQGNSEAYSTLIGPGKAGITNTFVFTKPDGTDVTISSTKSEFTTNTVILYDTLHLSSGVAGHLVFESFIDPSVNELATAFAFFKANNINDLILDLRYNPGGRVDIAQTLSSYIAGNSLSGTPFSKLEYNDKLTEYNYTFPFVTTPYSLGLTRLVVITTRSTASASELVINGLKPHLNVITVGDTTVGKPIGMNVFDVGKKYVFVPITFKMVNSADQGDYFEGLAPNKLAPDDITHDFNDRKELSLKEAISYLENGTFTSKGLYIFKNIPQYSEKPGWMNNMYLPQDLNLK